MNVSEVTSELSGLPRHQYVQDNFGDDGRWDNIIFKLPNGVEVRRSFVNLRFSGEDFARQWQFTDWGEKVWDYELVSRTQHALYPMATKDELTATLIMNQTVQEESQDD